MNTYHDEILNNIDICSEEHKILCKGLGEYVQLICCNRDKSHGYDHMKKVALNSMIIASLMRTNINLTTMTHSEFISLLLVVSWLHDVADRKYDSDGSIKKDLKIFIEAMFPNKSDLILDIILYASYSHEVKLIEEQGSIDWLNKFGNDLLIVRDILSDADKLEAIGKQGVIRCMTYNNELIKKSGKLTTFDNLIAQVREHADKKLIKLSEYYIRTDVGKMMSLSLHNEMIELLANDIELRKIYETFNH